MARGSTLIDSLTLWIVAGFLLHLVAAAGCAVAIVWMLRQPVSKRRDRVPTMAALGFTGVWAGIVAAFGISSEIALLAETARNLAWILVIYRLFSHDGRDLRLAGVRPMVASILFVELLQPVLLVVQINWAITPELVTTTVQTSMLLHMLVAIGALVLLHNLYVSAAPETQGALRWSAAGLASFWAFELNHYVVGYLSSGPAIEFSAIRGFVAAGIAAPLALGASNGLAGRKLQASHSAAFQTLSLLVIGVYLLLMFGAAQLLASLEGNLGRLVQIGFLIAAATFAVLWLPSQRMRGWLRVTVLKHMFQHRYDYREEWMRFTRTISHSGSQETSLYERAAQAMANIVHSPAAIVFIPGEDGQFRESAGWNWPVGDRALFSVPSDLASEMERQDYIIEVDAARYGEDGLAASVPKDILSQQDAWVLVPLIHYDRITGAVLLARPPVTRRLDWEDLDLLKVVARQLASYLAEHENHSALMESAKFDDFNRRIAFVMHDIKNLASQLSLLARNAEKHADNPEFRDDMLLTLRNGADKLNALLARLGRYGTGSAPEMRSVDLTGLARKVVNQFDGNHPVSLTRIDPCLVLADPEGLEQALVHLVQNAIDASEDNMAITLDVSSDGLIGKLEVIDSGTGMEADFVRHRLFKPFVSSKDGGFGIGAFEARELVKAMGGRLDVQSRPGVGTRFSITIPLAEAARILNSDTNDSTEKAA